MDIICVATYVCASHLFFFYLLLEGWGRGRGREGDEGMQDGGGRENWVRI